MASKGDNIVRGMKLTHSITGREEGIWLITKHKGLSKCAIVILMKESSLWEGFMQKKQILLSVGIWINTKRKAEI